MPTYDFVNIPVRDTVEMFYQTEILTMHACEAINAHIPEVMMITFKVSNVWDMWSSAVCRYPFARYAGDGCKVWQLFDSANPAWREVYGRLCRVSLSPYVCMRWLAEVDPTGSLIARSMDGEVSYDPCRMSQAVVSRLFHTLNKKFCQFLKEKSRGFSGEVKPV